MLKKKHCNKFDYKSRNLYSEVSAHNTHTLTLGHSVYCTFYFIPPAVFVPCGNKSKELKGNHEREREKAISSVKFVTLLYRSRPVARRCSSTRKCNRLTNYETTSLWDHRTWYWQSSRWSMDGSREDRLIGRAETIDKNGERKESWSEVHCHRFRSTAVVQPLNIMFPLICILTCVCAR